MFRLCCGPPRPLDCTVPAKLHPLSCTLPLTSQSLACHRQNGTAGCDSIPPTRTLRLCFLPPMIFGHCLTPEVLTCLPKITGDSPSVRSSAAHRPPPTAHHSTLVDSCLEAPPSVPKFTVDSCASPDCFAEELMKPLDRGTVQLLPYSYFDNEPDRNYSLDSNGSLCTPQPDEDNRHGSQLLIESIPGLGTLKLLPR